jgi:hypothetical protein
MKAELKLLLSLYVSHSAFHTLLSLIDSSGHKTCTLTVLVKIKGNSGYIAAEIAPAGAIGSQSAPGEMIRVLFTTCVPFIS